MLNIKNLSNRHLFMIMVGAIALLVMPFFLAQFGNSWVRIVVLALLYVMLALGLNIVVGMAGLLDLGYIAFYAVGAYMYALLASPHLMENFQSIAIAFPNGLHTPIVIVVLCAAALAAFFGVMLGAPTLKLRGDYLAIVTLGFGEIIRIFMVNLNAPINLTNGPQGINLIDSPSIFGHSLSKPLYVENLSIPSLAQYYYLFLLLVGVIIVVNYRLQHSRLGRAWMAIREDEIAAKAMGINTRNVKLAAFAIGASFGGISGAMFASLQGFVSPESFTLNESIVVLAMVVLGGMGHIPGVILGAVALYALPEVLRHTAGPVQQAIFGKEWISPEVLRLLIYGMAMVLIMLYRPKGLWPAPEHGIKPPALDTSTTA